MTDRDPLETRALVALYRNHPDTSPDARYRWDSRRRARALRGTLLSWAATLPDYRLLDCRNLGKTSLAWIRANEPTGYMAAVTYGTGYVPGMVYGTGGNYIDSGHGSPTLDVADLTRLIDDALEEWSVRSNPEPSDQVAVYLARRISENVVCLAIDVLDDKPIRTVTTPDGQVYRPDCGAYHPDHPGTRCRQPEGHSGEHATARLDVTWDNAYLSAPEATAPDTREDGS